MSYRSILFPIVGGALAVLAIACNPQFFFANGNDVNIDDGNLLSYAQSTINVGPSFTIGDVNIGVDIVHPEVADLDAYVQSPHGTIVHLIAEESGENFTGTVFDDEASDAIDTGSAPYTGRWKIDSIFAGESLSDFDGEDAQGTWTLNVRDKTPGNAGYITGWSLKFTTGGQ